MVGILIEVSTTKAVILYAVMFFSFKLIEIFVKTPKESKTILYQYQSRDLDDNKKYKTPIFQATLHKRGSAN
jgi:hypothetical protein